MSTSWPETTSRSAAGLMVSQSFSPFAGAGGSDLSAYDPRRYSSLDGYATDVIDVVRALDLHDVIFVGHSVSAMIGVLAAAREPERFGTLVLVAPSPRYIEDDAWRGVAHPGCWTGSGR